MQSRILLDDITGYRIEYWPSHGGQSEFRRARRYKPVKFTVTRHDLLTAIQQAWREIVTSNVSDTL